MPDMWANMLPLLPLLLALGAVSGFFAGLLGIGGGIILVPGLYYGFTWLGFTADIAMPVAVGTSLAIIIPTGISSAWAHWRRGAVDMTLVKRIGVGIVVGVLAGTLIANYVSGETLKAILAFALLLIAAIMALRPARFHIAKAVPGQPWAGFVGAAIGTLSTLMGVGGASMSVPFMAMCGVTMHRAVGTAAALGVIISMPATVGFMIIGWDVYEKPMFTSGYVNFLALTIIAPVSALVAPFGAHVAHSVSVDRLRLVFAGFLVIVSVKMLMDLYGV